MLLNNKQIKDMAKIKIENVPEVATISQILGVDSNNKWAKIAGGAYSTPADVAEAIKPVKQSADNAVAAATAATDTANSAKTTAEGIAGTANDAKTQSTQAVNTATIAKTSAEKNNDLLMGSVKWPAAGDITIYSGNWVNGTLDPKPATGQINSKFRCLNLVYRQGASRTLTLKGLMNFVGNNLHARLTVAVDGGGNLVLTEPSEGIQGIIVPVNPANNNYLATYVFSIELCETYCVVDCLYNCTFEQANPLQLLLNAERGTDIEVDSALSTTSENPVQNKVVAAALNTKAPLASPAFSGSPTAPTPESGDVSGRIATTQFVENSKQTEMLSYYSYQSHLSPNASWPKEGVFYICVNTSSRIDISLQSSLPITSKQGLNTCRVFIFGPKNSSLVIRIKKGSSNIGGTLISGLESDKMYVFEVYAIFLNSTYVAYITAQELLT